MDIRHLHLVSGEGLQLAHPSPSCCVCKLINHLYLVHWGDKKCIRRKPALRAKWTNQSGAACAQNRSTFRNYLGINNEGTELTVLIVSLSLQFGVWSAMCVLALPHGRTARQPSHSALRVMTSVSKSISWPVEWRLFIKVAHPRWPARAQTTPSARRLPARSCATSPAATKTTATPVQPLGPAVSW